MKIDMNKPEHIIGVFDDPESFVRFTVISRRSGASNIMTIAYDDSRPKINQYQAWDSTESVPPLPEEYCDVFGELLEWDKLDDHLKTIIMKHMK